MNRLSFLAFAIVLSISAVAYAGPGDGPLPLGRKLSPPIVLGGGNGPIPPPVRHLPAASLLGPGDGPMPIVPCFSQPQPLVKGVLRSSSHCWSQYSIIGV